MNTDEFYKSQLITSKDWHAGVQMVDKFFRYIKFFPENKWLRADHYPLYINEFDIKKFLKTIDIDKVLESNETPPINPNSDNQYLYQHGTYIKNGSEVILNFYDPLGDQYIEYKLLESENQLRFTDLEGNIYEYNNH